MTAEGVRMTAKVGAPCHSSPLFAPSSPRSVILALVARIHPRPPGMRRWQQILGTSPRMTAAGVTGGVRMTAEGVRMTAKVGAPCHSSPLFAPSSPRSVILALVARIHPRPPGMRRWQQILGTSPRMTAAGVTGWGEDDGGGWSASLTENRCPLFLEALQTTRPPLFRRAAAAASCVMPSQSSAATISFGATQEPPTLTTFGSDR